jgi:hypothetical protein
MKFNYLKRGLLALLLCAGFATTSMQANAAQLNEDECRAVHLFLDLVDIHKPLSKDPRQACDEIATILASRPEYSHICVILVNLKNLPKLKALLELKKAHNLLPAHLRDYMRQNGPAGMESTAYQMSLVRKFSCWQ